MGENHFAPTPVALYGAVLLMSAISYYILSRALIRHDGANSTLARALGDDLKGKISVAIYVAAIALAFVNRWLSMGLCVAVAVMWLIPDRRIERVLDRCSTCVAHGAGGSFSVAGGSRRRERSIRGATACRNL